ncbi:MAG: hypothetical protein ACTSSK_04640 [Candidatus Heimdallarchaeota archaeon]
MNPGPVMLFTMLAFYFVVKKKWASAFLWLAIATMTKQNAMFFTYPIFFFMLGNKLQKESLIIGLFIFVCFICAIPWIFINPANFLAHFIYPGKRIYLTSVIDIPEANGCIEFSYSLMKLGFRGWFLDFVAFGINSMLLMIASASVIAVVILWRSYKKKVDSIEFFEWMAVYMIVTHIFMPRGVFKFYSAYYMPLILIAIIGSLVYYTKKWKMSIISVGGSSLLFIWFSLKYLNINRFYAPSLLFLLALIILALLAIRMIFRTWQLRKENTFLRTI